MKSDIIRKRKRDAIDNIDIYSKPSNGTVYSPFGFDIDPMEKLMLVNFEKDPDEFYNILEFQQSRDNRGIKHILVIAYRKDGSTDVYHQAGFPFGSQDSVLNNASFFERSLDNAKFNVNSDLMEVYFLFEDKMGREIKVIVNERKREKKTPFFLLAPVGSNSKKPKSLPIYSLYEMSFTRIKHTDISIEINKVTHKPDTFPIPIDWSRNYFTRYSADTFNVDWNKNFNGQLSPLSPDNNQRIENLGVTYEMVEKSGHYEIKRMSAKNKKHKIVIEFYPPIPDIVCLRDEMDIVGDFSITTDNSSGAVSGYYQIKRQGNEIEIEINPNKGWEPNESRCILNLLFFFVKIFKEWPKSYVWNAKISLDEKSRPTMQSGWKRI
ncbi:hypothetical protein [Lunatibacter salilacus]|uniref:hypothetical protein n=1 Tax=Lunatibacter salilacus TaxID=2483804 RepID=UPI00131BE683|nr:hypothetical protein [Lunatibacter salilacus]